MLKSSSGMENLVKEILNKENIEFNFIVKASSGFTSLVYIVDDNYVIKLSKDDDIIKLIEKEVNVYKNLNCEFIPKLVKTGMYDEYSYVIITKLSGKSLFSVWHYLTEEKREECVKQICEILKFFHVQKESVVGDKFINKTFLQDLKNRVVNNVDLVSSFMQVQEVKDYFISNFDEIFVQEKQALIYNDAHFDNFLYNEGRVYLIDFDRVEYAPIDYELMIFKTMCDYPTKFASEIVEKLIHDEDFEKIYSYMQKYYSELFDIKNIEKRVFIYQFDYLLEQAVESKNNKWASSLIEQFKQFFSIS